MNAMQESGVSGSRMAGHVLIGAASGFLASLVMEMFQSRVSEMAQSSGVQKRDTPTKTAKSEDDIEPATMIAAEKVSETVLGHELRESEKGLAARAVHYSFGSGMGALYGGLSVAFPKMRTGFGLPYGIGIFTFADEGLVPALGLSKKRSEYPLSTHVYAFFSHLVYGSVLYLTERKIAAVVDSYVFHLERSSAKSEQATRVGVQ
jgi:uncharacterized membrane protein YagU involved in acid resistance